MSDDFDLGSYLAGGGSLVVRQKSLRAQIQTLRIADKPVSVKFMRNGAEIAAQTIRIEWNDSITDVESDLGRGWMRRGHIIHHQNHPTLPALDIEVWDTFRLDDKEYTVTSINRQLTGQLQATVEIV